MLQVKDIVKKLAHKIKNQLYHSSLRLYIDTQIIKATLDNELICIEDLDFLNLEDLEEHYDLNIRAINAANKTALAEWPINEHDHYSPQEQFDINLPPHYEEYSLDKLNYINFGIYIYPPSLPNINIT